METTFEGVIDATQALDRRGRPRRAPAQRRLLRRREPSPRSPSAAGSPSGSATCDFKAAAELTIRGNTDEVPLDVSYLGQWTTPYWEGDENKGEMTRIGFALAGRGQPPRLRRLLERRDPRRRGRGLELDRAGDRRRGDPRRRPARGRPRGRGLRTGRTERSGERRRRAGGLERPRRRRPKAAPTAGAVEPADQSRSSRNACTGSALPFISSPPRLATRAPGSLRMVASPIAIPPTGAALSSRAAVLTASPITV